MYICMGVGAPLLFHISECWNGSGADAGDRYTAAPVMSYGGSSIWSTFLMLGLVNSVRVRRFVN